MEVSHFYKKGKHIPEMHKEIWGNEFVFQLDFWKASELIEFADKLGLSKNAYVLDIGSGWGGPLILFAEKYGIIGDGVDISEYNINIAKDNAVNHKMDTRVKFHLCDIDKYLNDKKYDFIIMLDSLVHIKDKRKLLKKCYEMLTSNGKMLIAVECANSSITYGEMHKRNILGAVYTETIEEYQNIFLQQKFHVEYCEEFIGKRSEFASRALLWMHENEYYNLESMELIYELDRKKKVSEWIFILKKRK